MAGVKIFVSYCHKDRAFREELFKHMRAIIDKNIAVFWGDQSIQPGSNWESEILSKLNESSIILILVSVDYINSDFCKKEMNIALSRNNDGEATVIPIPIRSCDWTNLPLGEIQAATEDANPIDLALNRDQAWLKVVKSITGVINKVSQNQPQGENQANSEAPSILKEIVSDEIDIEKLNQETPDDKYNWVRYGRNTEEVWFSEFKKLLTYISQNSPDGTDLVRQHGSKIIIDFKRNNYKTLSRMIVSDTSGLIGSPGYQIKLYPTLRRDENLSLWGRYRWAVNSREEYYFINHYNRSNPLNLEQLSVEICEQIGKAMTGI